MGFLDGLTTLLGGFSDVKQIDKEGFDFREKRIAQQQARDQAREDWATRAATEASLGTDDEAEVASVIPSDVNRARVLARTRGAGLQSKSSLAAQKAYDDAALQGVRGAQRLEQIAATGDEAQELARIRADLASKTLTPFQRQSLELREKDLARRAALGAAGGRARYDKVAGVDPSTGAAGTWYINRDTQTREFIPAAPTAATRGKEESKGAAMQAFDELMGIYDAFGGQPDDGIEARALGMKRSVQGMSGYNPEVQVYRGGVRGFVPLMARALGHVGVLTELDVERTEALFPGPGDTKAEALKKRQILTEIMTGRRPPPFQIQTDDGAAPVGGTRVPRPPAPPVPGGRPIVQQNKRTGEWRHSVDGGRTWAPGRP